MKGKNYTVEFYIGRVGADGQSGLVSNLLNSLHLKQSPHVATLYGVQYEIRDLVILGNGATFMGNLAKYREDDLPHAGSPGGQERELLLKQNEGLIEKNYFIYHRQFELLIYQRNMHGSTTNRLAEYLSTLNGDTVTFNPVLQLEPMKRLMAGNVTARSLTLSVAMPTNPNMYSQLPWNDQLMKTLSGAGGTRMRVEITSDSRSSDEDKRKLSDKLKAAVNQLVSDDVASVAKFEVEEDGLVHPIDLIADRLLSIQTVPMSGRYPDQNAMYTALSKAKTEVNSTLTEIFGTNDHALD